jgi:hypothetical protein
MGTKTITMTIVEDEHGYLASATLTDDIGDVIKKIEAKEIPIDLFFSLALGKIEKTFDEISSTADEAIEEVNRASREEMQEISAQNIERNSLLPMV